MIEPPPHSLQAGRRRPVAACWGADSYQQAARAAPDCRGAVERPCATRPRHTVAGMSAASCTSLQALEARLQQHAVAASLSEQRAPAAAADDDDDLAGQYLQLPKGTETHREKQCAFCKVRGDGGHRGRNTRFHRCRRTQPTPAVSCACSSSWSRAAMQACTQHPNVAENDTFGVGPAFVPRECSDAPPPYR
jgi:hypothetical protein